MVTDPELLKNTSTFHEYWSLELCTHNHIPGGEGYLTISKYENEK